MRNVLRLPRRLNLLAIALAAVVVDSALAAKSILRLRLDGPVMEAPAQDAEMAVLFGGQKPNTLHELVDKIHAAAKDANINGIAMIIESPQVSIAQVEELTRALRDFRAAGKKVYAYLDYATNSSFALACAADHITLAEYSTLDIRGLNAELSYYKGLLDKLGMVADMLHCGAYKSALEPYTRTEPSKEAAENINWLLDGIYTRWIQLMADGRKLSPQQVTEAVDIGLLDAKPALDRKMIDAVGTFADYTQMMHKEFGDDAKVVKNYPSDEELDIDIDPENPMAMFMQMSKVFEKILGANAENESKDGIGLIYVDGPITTGKSQQGGFMGGASAGSTTVRAAFEEALKDDHVKAVVLRVDSPGGSALASDIIWNAARRLSKSKPLIVSMGGVAGSGGYYVAIPGQTIFAEESTITGSIGVVGGKIVWNGFWEGKLGITTTAFTRGKSAALMTTTRAWTDDERNRMQNWMNGVYDQFKGRVTESRGDRIKGNLEDLAGGRVYTGKQALEHGLVDKIGGLSDAIAFAADKAGLKDYDVYDIPKKKDFLEAIKTLMGEESDDEFEISASPLAADPLARSLGALIREIAPEQAHTLFNAAYRLMILDREHVGCFMPTDITIR